MNTLTTIRSEMQSVGTAIFEGPPTFNASDTLGGWMQGRAYSALRRRVSSLFDSPTRLENDLWHLPTASDWDVDKLHIAEWFLSHQVTPEILHTLVELPINDEALRPLTVRINESINTTLEAFASLGRIERLIQGHLEEGLRYQELDELLHKIFGVETDVLEIYRHNTEDDDVVVWIVTGDRTYDYSFRKRLVEHELKVRRQSKPFTVNIKYLPRVLSEHPRTVIGESARLIFQR